jgi:L-glutamine-phosphate cytidylyltransferase
MKVLIMAAGIGSRISRHLNGQPKCCVNVNGMELIRYTFELLNKKGITNIAIVTGYNEHCILDALKEYSFTHYQNHFYDVTNSIASTWFAQEFLDENEDIIMMNGDVFIEEKVLDILLKPTLSPLFLSDSSRIEDADYKFTWENNLLINYGKELSNEETTGEYVGIAKINTTDISFMKSKLNEFIAQQKHSYWWEDIFYRSIKEKPVFVEDIKGIFWAEVDYIEDYERIKEYLNAKDNHG